MKPLAWIAAGVVLGAALAAAVLRVGLAPRSASPRPTALDATWTLAEDPTPVRGWSLARADGAPFRTEDLVGHWSVVFVGYTSCPDVCPTTLHALAAARSTLPDVEVLFLSVDPERDAPGLAAYVGAFDPAIVGLTGDAAAIAHAAASLGASFAPSASDPGLIDHSTSLFVVDPVANVAGYLLRPSDPDRLTSSLRALQNAHQPVLDGRLWTPRQATTASVVYGTVRTASADPVWVTAVHGAGGEGLMLHETVERDGIASMVHHDRVQIGREAPLELAPGGYHLMGRGPEAPAVVEWTLQDGRAALMRTELRDR